MVCTVADSVPETAIHLEVHTCLHKSSWRPVTSLSSPCSRLISFADSPTIARTDSHRGLRRLARRPLRVFLLLLSSPCVLTLFDMQSSEHLSCHVSSRRDFLPAQIRLPPNSMIIQSNFTHSIRAFVPSETTYTLLAPPFE